MLKHKNPTPQGGLQNTKYKGTIIMISPLYSKLNLVDDLQDNFFNTVQYHE